MPITESSGFSPLASFGRSLLSLKRDQVHSMDPHREPSAFDSELEIFQQQVAKRLKDLYSVSSDQLLSFSWMQKLLDMFVCCLEEFRVILVKNKEQASKPPLDRMVDDFFERSIKALDICNATQDGIEKIRSWQKPLDIVVCALESRQRAFSEGQFRRARKALMDLALLMLEEKDSGWAFSYRNRSFGGHNTKKDHQHNRNNSGSGHSRSHSWSVSNSWSAAKQLQSIANNLVPPRGNEIAATNGVAVPIFTISSVLVFVLWALVAAIPCQDRSINVNFVIPRSFTWGTTFLSLHDRIVEESKKRDHRNSCGLLREIYQVEKSIHYMTDLVESVQFPLTEEQKKEVEERVVALSLICETIRNDLDPLERQVREVFRRIMNCRIEGLDKLSKGSDVG